MTAAAIAGFCSVLSAQQPANSATPPQTAQQQPRQQMETLAVVNGQPVTRQQVATECLRRFGEEVLESIVNKQLVLNECHKRGVMITEGDVNNEIVDRAKKFGMSGDRYIDLICSRRHITVDRLKNDIIWNELALRRLAEADLQVTPEEIAEQLEFEFGTKVQVREIAVNTQGEAQQIVDQARANPENFERLAKTHSLDTNTASMGGLLPPIRKNSGFPAFETVAFSLQPDQVSDVFQVEDKFIILKCERIFPAMQLTPEQENDVRERLVEEISRNKLAEVATNLFQTMQEEVIIINVMNDEKLSLEMPGVAAMVDQTRISKQQVAEECINQFGKDMLETEISRTLLLQALREDSIEVSQDDINAEIGRAASDFGFLNQDGTPDTGKWLTFITRGDASKVSLYMEDELWPTVAMRKLVEPGVQVTEQDLQKGFEANFGPRVEVLVVVCNDQRQALKVWRMASSNPEKKYFGELASEYSVEPMSQGNFGVVPPIQQHSGSPELEAEAFSLQVGEISKVIQVDELWYILFCTGHTTPRVTDFEAVKGEIHKKIFDKKLRIAMAGRFNTIRASAQIDNFMAGTSQTGAEMIRSARESGEPNGQQR